MLIANVNSQNINPMTVVNQENQVSKAKSKSFVSEMSKYVMVANNKYTINPSIYSNKAISAQEISKLQSVLNKSNKALEKLGVKNLNVENGNFVNSNLDSQTSNKSNTADFWEIANGTNGIQFFWWGFYLSLNSVYTQMIINSGGGGIGAALGGALGALTENPIAAVGGAVAGAVIGEAIATLGDNSSEAYYGSVTSYNYATGVQAIWTQ